MREELSPITGKPMRLIAEQDVAEFRGENFTYTHFAYRCCDSGEQFTTDDLDAINTAQVYNAYRAKHNYPFPDEIAAIRSYYGVSAAMMSQIMGFGANQWRYYEADKVPNESNARAIATLRFKSVFLTNLDAARTEIGDKAYTSIKERVSSLAEYRRTTAPTEDNGYLSFSLDKTSEAIKFFISQLGGVFVTKMNKLLFYADFLKYKRDGFGMTGLEYRAMQYGPVPLQYGEIYSHAADVEMEDFIYPNGTSGQILTSTKMSDMSVFSTKEIDVLTEISSRFRDVSAGAISEFSHREKGWQVCCAEKGIIPYSYAFLLNID